MTPWPAWLRFGLLLPLIGVNAFVLKAVLVEFAPFPGLFLTSALIAFLLDLPCRWLMGRGLSRAGSITLVMLLTVGLLGLAAVALLIALANPALQQEERAPLSDIVLMVIDRIVLRLEDRGVAS